jgi:hypothetical protein
MSKSPSSPGESPRIPLDEAAEAAILREVESAANLLFADRGEWRPILVDEITDVLREGRNQWRGMRYAGTCHVCLFTPANGWFVNVAPTSLGEGRPKFAVNVGWNKVRDPAICEPCASREWPEWETNVLTIAATLARGSAPAREAALALVDRFSRRRVQVVVARAGISLRIRECNLCGTEAPGVHGPVFFVCLECMREAREVMWEAECDFPKRSDGGRLTKADEHDLPFPDAILADAKAVAKHLRARRAQVLGPPPAPPPRRPDDALWDEMRRLFAKSSCYSNMRYFDEGIPGSTPPADLLDLVGTGLARILAHEGLNGYRQRDRAQFTDGRSVVGDRWVPQAVGSFLWKGGMSADVRELLDEALVLLRHALEKGACYMEYDDQLYEDVSWSYLDLVRQLYDYRAPQRSALHDGALLLHGGRAEERLTIAREIHLARTGGLDARREMDFVIFGEGGEGHEPQWESRGGSTVYIADPLALSAEDQAWLVRRLDPDGPPGPTILGADDEAHLREQAQSRLLPELVPRLYAFELDVRIELARGASPA